MSTLSKQGAKIAAPVSDEQLKWLNWPDFVQVCQGIKDAESLFLMDVSSKFESQIPPGLSFPFIWAVVAMLKGSCHFTC